MRVWGDDRKLSDVEKQRKIESYTIPKKTYNYSNATWDDYISNKWDGYRTIRSSIIPITVIDGKTYWILGSFHDYPRYILTDFGGNCVLQEGKETNRQTAFGCAILEVHEESKGLLTQMILRNIGLIEKQTMEIYIGKINNSRRGQDDKVYFFFVPVNYEEIKQVIETFNSTSDISEKFGPLDFYEEEVLLSKTEKQFLTSFNLTDLIKHLSNQ